MSYLSDRLKGVHMDAFFIALQKTNRIVKVGCDIEAGVKSALMTHNQFRGLAHLSRSRSATSHNENIYAMGHCRSQV